jgi:uncharacterized phage infection (PIP) family protein YhgE
MADTREFFDENLVGLSDPEKYNLYGGLAEMADELSALHDQVNKLSEKADELSALHDQINKLSAKADELSALHDQMNKLSAKADELSALPDQMNKLEAALAEIGQDMRELRKSLRVAPSVLLVQQSPRTRARRTVAIIVKPLKLKPAVVVLCPVFAFGQEIPKL